MFADVAGRCVIQVRSEIIESVKKNQVTLIIGGTGCGKTTRKYRCSMTIYM